MRTPLPVSSTINKGKINLGFTIVVITCMITAGLSFFLFVLSGKNNTSEGYFLPGNIMVIIVVLILLLAVGLIWAIRSRKLTLDAYLTKSEELELYFANSIDMLCIADTQGVFRRLNSEWSRSLGYELSELEGKPYVEFVHPEDVEKTIQATKQLTDKGKLLNFVNRYRHKDGSYRWIEWRSYSVGNMIYASARNITDRIRAEEERQENMERALAFSDATNEGIVISENGIVVEANKQFLDILGYHDITEIAGKSILDEFTPPESRKTVKKHIESNSSEAYESTSYHKDKSIFPIEIKGHTILLKGREMRITAIRDLTGQKLVEQEMRQTDLWLRDSQRNSHIGSYNYDIVADHWKSSEELDVIFGIPADYDKSSAGWSKLIHPEHQEEMRYHLEEHVVKQHHTFNKEYSVVRQNDGEIRWVHGLGYLNFNKEGQAIQMVGTIADITDRRKAEDALKQSEQKYRLLFENMTSGFALHEIVYDDHGNPEDLRFLEVNTMFEIVNGLKVDDIRGKRLKEAIPYIDDHFLANVGAVLKGEIKNFVHYIEPYHKYLEFIWYEPVKGQIAAVFNDITNRVQAENELKLSEKKFADIFNLSPNVLGISRVSDGKLLVVNPAYSILTGYSMEEYTGKTTFELSLWAYPGQRDQMIKELREKGEVSNVEIGVRVKDGSIRECLFSVKNISYNNEVCIIFIIHDISTHKRTERELAQARVFTDALLNSVPGLVYLYDEEGYLKRWNKNHEEFTGYNAEELSRMHLLDWYKGSESDIAAVTAGIQKTLVEGYGTAEAYLTKKNGEKKLLYFTAVSIEIEGKKYFTGIGLDITERKKAENELKESEAKARLFVENVPLPVAMFDTEMHYILTSNRWSIDYKLGDQSLIGRSHYEVFPEISDTWKDDHKRVLSGEIYKNNADCFQRADGSIQWLRYELYPWYKADQTIGGLVMFTEDITERKKVEDEIIKLNTQLEIRVQDRTFQLQQVNKDLESFAYSVSHDLRAPLRHIDGFAKLMYSKLDHPNDIVSDYYGKIEASTKRMSVMIDDLLTFSRLGRKELITSLVDLNVLVKEIIEQLKPDIASRKIKWNIHRLPKVYGDKNLLKMAFENLISNAIKYTSKKEEGNIEMGAIELQNGYTDIFIKDNGAGFNMKYADKLFGVFQRLHSNEEFDGTGIGLANVKQIVTKHNGSIRAEGKINEGAIFYITLPNKP